VKLPSWHKAQRLHRNFSPLAAGTQKAAHNFRAFDLINNSLFNDDLLCILALFVQKEKWGIVTLQDRTCKLVLRTVQAWIFKLASSIYQRADRAIWQRA